MECKLSCLNKCEESLGKCFVLFQIKFGKIPKTLSKEGNVKIDAEMMKEYNSKRSHEDRFLVALRLDYFKIIESVFSKDLPPERYQGLMNLVYLHINPFASSEEIESALVMCGSVNRILIPFEAEIYLMKFEFFFLQLGLFVWHE